MIVLAYLLLLFKLISAQRLGLRGERPGLRPFYNVAPKPGPGVGVLQDLTNARILSNEPFIISFEFPKIERPGTSRKSKFGAKRSRTQRKKNRRLRQFRQVLFPEGDYLERAKRYQTLQKPLLGGNRLKSTNLMIMDGGKARILTQKSDNGRLYDRFGFQRSRNFEDDEMTSRAAGELERNMLQQIINAKRDDNASEENIDAENHKQWENIKGKWMSLFQKDKEPGNDIDEEQARIKAKSQKMWANCQLLKLLKAPQRNPYFYKLLPPNYPAFVMNEEKQLECNKVYDIIDLSKDKKMIGEKIKELEKILSADDEDPTNLPVVWKTEEEPKTRKRRDVEVVEKKQEEQNTLQDESLQGKTEGEVRTDRNRRTKERLNKRKRIRTRGEKAKNKKKKESPRQAEEEKPTENEQPTKETVKGERKAEEGQIASNNAPKIVRLEEKNIELDTHEHESESKKEREIKPGAILQDVFNPTEVNKVIKQKELEANIFDKVVRAMKKYEENNPYDESFVPQKRESRNDTLEMPEKADSGESILEVDDAVRKLAKIFKILGVKTDRKKCSNCDGSEESSYEEDAGKIKKTDLVRAGPQNGKCTCEDDCPVCHNCLRCFKECKKNMVAARNRQTPAVTAYKDGYPGLTSASKPLYSNGGMLVAEPPLEDNAPGRMNQPKAERMYRSKLPPSKDFIKVYFDNPDNKLLVWTKRGRRTMPWGPLTSDLQLYRDRAKQILKSAEDILQRIKETEDKIHGTAQIDDNDHETPQVSSNNEKNMDDIIKKVVNEDAMKKFLTTPWKDTAEATEDANKVADGVISQGIQVHEDELNSNGKKDPDIRIEEYGQAPRPDIESLFKSEEFEEASKEAEGMENDSKVLEKKLNSVLEKEPESVEAAVQPIKGNQEKTMNTLYSNSDAALGNKEVGEEEEYEDIPAKVEAISDNKMFKIEVQDDGSEKVPSKNEDFSREDQFEEAKVRKTLSQQSEEEEDNMKKAFGEESQEEEEVKVKKAFREESEEDDTKIKKAFSEESEEEEEAKVKKAFSGESEEEEAKVKKAFSGESEEEEAKVKKAFRGESEEDDTNVKKVFSEESQEEEAKVKKAFKEVSEEEDAKLKIPFREESEEEDANVKKPFSEESQEEAKVKEAFSEESEEEEAKVKKAFRGESEEDDTNVKKAFSEESQEQEEDAKVKKVFSEESQEEEEAKVKKAFKEESEEEDAKLKKASSEESEEGASDSKKKDILSAKEIIKQLRKAVEKHKKMARERNKKVNKYRIMDENKAEGERKESYDEEESERDRNNFSDDKEPVEMRKNLGDDGEPLQERKSEKYESDEEQQEAVEERKSGKYGSDEEAVEERKSGKYESEEETVERKNGEYESDEEEAVEERKSGKYGSDEEAVEERKSGKYGSDEEAVEERKSGKYGSDEEAVEERKNGEYESDEETVEERKKGKYESDEEEAVEERKNGEYESEEETAERKNGEYESDEEAVEKRKSGKYDRDEEEGVEERENGKYDTDEEAVEERKSGKYGSDEEEAVEERKNGKYDSDEEEGVKDREKGKYDSDEEEEAVKGKSGKYESEEETVERKNGEYESEEEAVEERKNGKYDTDEKEAVKQRKKGKYDTDEEEEEAVEERKNGKYDSDEEERRNEKFDSDENSDVIERKNTQSYKNKDMGKIKNGHIHENEDKGGNKNSNIYSGDDILEEMQKGIKNEEEVKPVDVKAITPTEQENGNTDAIRAKSTDPNNEYKNDQVSNRNIYEDHIKPLEEDYIIKGVKKTKEEKDAILKALLNAEEKVEEEPPQETTTETFYYYTHPTEISQLTPKPPEHVVGDGLQTLIQHIQGGYMNEDDFKAVKKLDESKIASLVGEMQKNDKQKATIDCNKEIELCKIACGCNESNTTTTEVDKYDIMKGFLRWLKNVQLDHMVPISV